MNFSQLSVNETQTYVEIKQVTPVPGTSGVMAEQRTTAMHIIKATGIAPLLLLNYRIGALQLSAGAQYGFITAPRYTTSFTDTALFYPATAAPQLSPPFRSNRFSGSQFISTITKLSFTVRKRWQLEAQYATELWQKRTPGITSSQKKGAAFSIGISYNF
jgi:hypothetical protein